MVGRMIGPQIVTNFHKLICVDMCRMAANCFFFDRINKINRIGVGVDYIL